jgi:hypothetical protein
VLQLGSEYGAIRHCSLSLSHYAWEAG